MMSCKQHSARPIVVSFEDFMTAKDPSTQAVPVVKKGKPRLKRSRRKPASSAAIEVNDVICIEDEPKVATERKKVKTDFLCKDSRNKSAVTVNQLFMPAKKRRKDDNDDVTTVDAFASILDDNKTPITDAAGKSTPTTG